MKFESLSPKTEVKRTNNYISSSPKNLPILGIIVISKMRPLEFL